MINGFLHRCVELVRQVQHAVAAVGKTAAFRIDVGERGHQRRRARPADAALLRHVRQFARFVAQARIGQRLDAIQRIAILLASAIASNTPTGGKRLGHDAVGALPADAFIGGGSRHDARFSKAPLSFRDASISPSLRIQILPHHEQVGDVAGQHALQRGLAAEGRCIVRPAQPRVGAIRLREQDRQRLEDAEQVADALQRVARQRAVVLALPFVERRFRRIAEQFALLGDLQFQRSARLKKARNAGRDKCSASCRRAAASDSAMRCVAAAMARLRI